MSWHGRICLLVGGLCLLTAPLVIWAALQALSIEVADTSAWVSPTNSQRLIYERFTREFENGDLLLVSWDGCMVDDPRLAQVAARLRSRQMKTAAGLPLFERVVTGGELLERLVSEPLELERDVAVSRLRGHMLGPDGAATCLAITFSKAGVAARTEAVACVRETLRRHGVTASQEHLAGPIMNGHDVDLASEQAMRRFAPFSILAILLSCWWCTRSWRIALILFTLAAYCQAMTLALVHLRGDHLTPLMIVLPPLVLVNGVSGGIHLVNYYFDALSESDPARAPAQAFRVGWLPCLLSSGTTAVGMASLMMSDLAPVREFGLYSATGVLITLVMLFLLLPGALELWAQPRGTRSPASTARAASSSRFTHSGPLADWLSRRAGWLTIVSLVVLCAAGWGCRYVRTSVHLSTLFRSESRLVQDCEWLERTIGPLVPVELLVSFPAGYPLNTFDRSQLVANIEHEILTLPNVGSTLSAVTFLPEIKLGKRNLKKLVARTIANRKMESARESLEQSGFLRPGPDGETWRVTARVSWTNDEDYGLFLQRLGERIQPLLASATPDSATLPRFELTGAFPMIDVVQTELLRALASSFLSAILVITVVMMFALRGVGAGLIAMIPNVFPIVSLFGLLGWSGFPVDIGSVMTASIALGMAVDGTLHYLTFFRRAQRRGSSPADANRFAMIHCAGALAESAMICALGLATFAFSTFLPTQRFAVVMVGLIGLSLAGDLLVLPALLAGPLGACFRYGRPSVRERSDGEGNHA